MRKPTFPFQQFKQFLANAQFKYRVQTIFPLNITDMFREWDVLCLFLAWVKLVLGLKIFLEISQKFPIKLSVLIVNWATGLMSSVRQ